jgi:hypothetical protein
VPCLTQASPPPGGRVCGILLFLTLTSSQGELSDGESDSEPLIVPVLVALRQGGE